MDKAYVTIMSGEAKPRYYVARRKIGGAGYQMICTCTNETNASMIADAMNAAAKRATDAVFIPIPVSKQRKRA